MNITVKAGVTANYCFVTSQSGAGNKPNTVEHCYGISDKLEKIWSGDTTGGAGFSYKTVVSWRVAIGSELHSSFNGYWTIFDSGLKFGKNVVLNW